MARSSEQQTRLRQQASVEAEVAQSRLALAHQDLAAGNTELALRRSVEAAFDAGVAYGYAKQAKQKNFSQQTKALLAEAQAIADAAEGKKTCDGAYKIGVKYASARCGNSENEVQIALAEYESLIDEVGVGRLSNPAPLRKPTKKIESVRSMKSRLLR